MKDRKRIEKLDEISRSTELLYRRAAMLNLYLCRIRNAGADKARLAQELKTLHQLIDELERKISAS